MNVLENLEIFPQTCTCMKCVTALTPSCGIHVRLFVCPYVNHLMDNETFRCFLLILFFLFSFLRSFCKIAKFHEILQFIALKDVFRNANMCVVKYFIICSFFFRNSSWKRQWDKLEFGIYNTNNSI